MFAGSEQMRTFPHAILLLETFDTEFKTRSIAPCSGCCSTTALDEIAEIIGGRSISIHFYQATERRRTSNQALISNEATGWRRPKFQVWKFSNGKTERDIWASHYDFKVQTTVLNIYVWFQKFKINIWKLLEFAKDEWVSKANSATLLGVLILKKNSPANPVAKLKDQLHVGFVQSR